MGYTQGGEGARTPNACPHGFPPGVSPNVGDNSAGPRTCRRARRFGSRSRFARPEDPFLRETRGSGSVSRAFGRKKTLSSEAGAAADSTTSPGGVEGPQGAVGECPEARSQGPAVWPFLRRCGAPSATAKEPHSSAALTAPARPQQRGQAADDACCAASGDVSNDTSSAASGDASGDVSNDVSGNAPNDTSNDASGDASGDASRDVCPGGAISPAGGRPGRGRARFRSRRARGG